MSSNPSESSCRRRTSERRRLKMLKNSKEFKIANPYKCNRQPVLPEELTRQLRKIDFLSSTSISMLSFQKENTPLTAYEAVLQKMSEATRTQEERYQSLFGSSDSASSEYSEELDSQPLSEYIRKEHSLAEEIITTKEEISLTLYDHHYPIHHSIFDRPEEDQDHILENPQSCHNDLKLFQEKTFQVMIMEDEYENYFIN